MGDIVLVKNSFSRFNFNVFLPSNTRINPLVKIKYLYSTCSEDQTQQLRICKNLDCKLGEKWSSGLLVALIAALGFACLRIKTTD